MQRIAGIIGLLVFGLLAADASAEAIPLNDHTRLGQRLTADMPWNGVWIIAPSWSDSEGGLTLTLWDSPQRGKRLAQQTFVDFADNARLEVWLPQMAAPGPLYWEIGERTGTTRVGLYAQDLPAETDDCAYLDGVPNRKLKFNSGPTYSPGRHFADAGEMIAALTAAAELADKSAACRELALVGDGNAIPVLAGLLGDEALSHLARYALEPMPDPAVDDALRAALDRLQGTLLVGVINSLGVRRDGKAVPPLTGLLGSADATVASAAAVALGRIATPAAAQVLAKALDTASPSVLPAVREGCLQVADLLVAQGQQELARPLFARLGGADLPVPVRQAALRGMLLGDPSLLAEQLRSPDPVVFRSALWVLQRELPGAEATRAAAATLDSLPAERQPLLIQALGGRGDAAALSRMVAALRNDAKEVRLAAIGSLPKVGGEAAIAPLIAALTDPDAELGKAARDSLERLPRPAVDQALVALLESPEKVQRLVALELVARRQAPGALPAVLVALRGNDPEIRLAALNASRSLAGADDIPVLIQVLTQATEAAERKAAEGALGTVCSRCGAAAVAPVGAALAGAAEENEAALLRVLGTMGGQSALDLVVVRLDSPREPVRQEARRTVGAWRDRTAVSPLLALARKADDQHDRILAIRGLVRLAGPRPGEWEGDVNLLNEAMRLSQRPDEKRLALGVAGGIATRPALGLAVRALADAELRNEASTAAVAIAEKLPRPGDSDVGQAMAQVVALAPDAGIRARAEKVLAQHRAAVASVAANLAGKIPAKAVAVPGKPRRLLLFDVNVTYGGHPARFAANDAFALMGTSTGAFEAVVSRDPEVFRPESLKQFDAVCFNSTVGLLFEDPALRDSLADFVYGGGGLLGIHASTFAFIDWDGKRGDTWPEFGTMLGARGGSHADQNELVTVKLDDPTHPLNAVFGGQGFDYRDEYFRVQAPYSRDRVRVLFSIDAGKTDLASHKLPDELKKPDGDYPLAWVRNYGRGRVCYSTIGHNERVFADPTMLAFYLGAIQFVLGDLPAPTLPSNRLTPAARAQEKLGWRLGMTAYSLHKFTFFETVDKTAELGLSYINTLSFQKVSDGIPKMFGPELTDEEIRQIRKKMDEGHVRLLTHFIGKIPGDEAGCRRVFEFARKLGIEVLISEPAVQDLAIIERFCDEYDIKLGLHNHGPKESPNTWSPEKVLELCQGRSPRIGACVDVGYWLRNGIDPVQGIRTLGNRLITLQMHDLNERSLAAHDVPWGTGAGGSRELFQAIRDTGVAPTMFGLEYSYNWLESMPEMAQCAAFFNAIVIELAK